MDKANFVFYATKIAEYCQKVEQLSDLTGLELNGGFNGQALELMVDIFLKALHCENDEELFDAFYECIMDAAMTMQNWEDFYNEWFT